MLSGLCRGTVLPDEFIIVHMNEPSYDLGEYPFFVRELCIHTKQPLPLAQARNFAAREAIHEQLIFLDADCIPSKSFVEKFSRALGSHDALLSGRVAYLPKSAMTRTDLFSRLHQLSIPDPVRKDFLHYPYHLFWSLNFGCSRDIYDKIGGFDEDFEGYGAEDTDFGFSARRLGVEMITINAFAYHQYHPSYDPPINHLQPIVKNAKHFKTKWGEWPMEGWLKKFSAMGYLRFTKDELEMLRMPVVEEFAALLKDT